MAAVRSDPLRTYRAKRRFERTPEPAGEAEVAPGRRFVVHKHAARRLHYDLRLQMGDTFKSWAVTRGPSLDPHIRRLAVHVEDHPLDYGDFEGVIPKGEYGAGAVIIWDKGAWTPREDPEAALAKGQLKFTLDGEKLRGGFTLVRLKDKESAKDNWLLIKERDEFARDEDAPDILDEAPASVVSARTVEDVFAERDPARPEASVRPARVADTPVRAARLPGARKAGLPAAVAPQLASPIARVPAGDDWLHEIKFDGYRTLACIDGSTVKLLTRNGLDWTERYGGLAAAFGALPCRQAIVDGEIVVQEENGAASFSALQQALSSGRTERLVFYAFDLVWLDGHDLSAVPLERRKEALARLVAPAVHDHGPIQLSEHVRGQGPAFLRRVCDAALEGVVSKRADAPYQPGRSRTWVKVKCANSDDFVVVGFTESVGAGGLAAMALAERGADGLAYVGRVGTGYTADEAAALRTRLRPLARRDPPVAVPAGKERAGVTWVEPRLVVDVRYGSRTGDGRLRHAVYRGLREDKTEPQQAAAAEPPTPRPRWLADDDLASVQISHPDRIVFGGPRKLDLALYYARVADLIMPELVRRPVTLLRCPSGVAAECFYQRHFAPGMPETLGRIALDPGEEPYVCLEDACALLGLAQFGVVEFHLWGCRVDRPEYPDRLVFDLDPDETLRWRDVLDGAAVVRERVERLGLAPFVKTTGGKGVHVVVPLRRRHAWPEVARFCRAFAASLARDQPKRFTDNPAKGSRRNRIYLDYLRNKRGASAVAAYSLRARPGVPVATPVTWNELGDIDDPAVFDYASVPDRLTALAVDPWGEMDRAARALTAAMARMVGVSDWPTGRGS